jgi:DNA-binding transcriptional MocR family regulator
MMIPFDSSEPPARGELDPATTEAMRAAIARAIAAAGSERFARATPPEDDAALREALHRVAREARERAIPPERLLVLLKGMWQAASAGQRDAGQEIPRTEQERRLRDFVTLCITEYFRDD